ncbi:hypothetical protein PYW07_016073 [Mythimna separata]|uniref:DUF7041 domain-containing protein n=1 Tax=Mythimna separata TaxID=271217 RepID=A0AAD7YRY3_MYTSE|nr:hypothetical protein PYW07_016073 [Mythimna separata]
MEDKATTDEYVLSLVSITDKIEDFWPRSPELWFVKAEAIINPQKMSDESKYRIILSKLNLEVTEQVADILLNPPKEKKYETLKQKLISVYKESAERQIKKLIGEMELGDQRPSYLLRKMRDLARGKVTDETLKVMWKNHLPPSVRGVLAVTDEEDMEKLASIADKVAETITPIHSVSTVKEERGPANDDMVAAINKLSDRLSKIETDSRGRSRNYGSRRLRSSSRSSSRSRKATAPIDDPNWLCKFHFRYRNRARKCVPPCNWKKKDSKPSEN